MSTEQETSLPQETVEAIERLTTPEAEETSGPRETVEEPVEDSVEDSAVDMDSVDSEPSGDDHEEASAEPDSWWSESDIALGRHYQLKPEEVQAFGNRDSFLLAVRLMDERLRSVQSPEQKPQEEVKDKQPESPSFERIKLKRR